MSVTHWLVRFAQAPDNFLATEALQVGAILLGVLLFIQSEMIGVGSEDGRRTSRSIMLGALPLLTAFTLIILARFLRILI